MGHISAKVANTANKCVRLEQANTLLLYCISMTDKEKRLRAAAKAFMKVLREETDNCTTEDDTGEVLECIEKVQDAISPLWDKLMDMDFTEEEAEPYC